MAFSIQSTPVLILAGGRGTRLQSEVSDRAKPMADINGRPFVELLLKKYRNHRIIFSLGYMKDTIMDYYKDVYQYIIEDEPLGTGGAIKKAFEEVDVEYLIVVNGDTYTDFDLTKAKPATNVLINTVYQEDCSRYGYVDVKNNKVRFNEKGHSGPGFINSGVYIIHRDALKDQPERFSFEDYLIECNDITVVQHEANFIDIGVPDDYFKAIKQFG